MKYHGEEYACLRGCDEMVITACMPLRNASMGSTPRGSADVLRNAGNTVNYIPENTDVVPYLSERVSDGDMVIFFGGDDFFRMADAWADERV